MKIKSLSKIFMRYLLTALIIILVTLFLNVILYVIAGFRIIQSTNHHVSQSRTIAEELQILEGTVTLSDTGCRYLEESGYEWAMLIDDRGEVIWNWNLPSDLDHVYTPNQIAAFSKWYLADYPVTERVTDYGLLVIASPKNSIWKQNFSDSVTTIETLAYMIPITFIANLIFVFLLSLFLGFLFYRSLRVIAIGIERLSEQKPIRLPEKGITEMLAKQLNQTADVLMRQKESLEKRDNARTDWISGVSHDIRTPLSLIMGYSSALKEAQNLTEEQRRQVTVIEAHSLQIKHLIEDLNLTSRLEYEMQPLRPASFSPSRMLREIVSDFYNQGLADNYTIDLQIDPEAEQITLSGDTALLTRAFRNLIHNSIRHNPEGCTVTISVCLKNNSVRFQITDDGCGIPENVIQALTGNLSEFAKGRVPQSSPDAPQYKKAPHIMGLRIVWQIVKAHGWQMGFPDVHTVRILCPEILSQ